MPKMVRGIITQGARGLEGSTSAENRAFVRKYKLAHSITGKEWTTITDKKTGFAKVKMGKTHTNIHTLLSDCHCQFFLICCLFLAVFQLNPSSLCSFPPSLRLSFSLLGLVIFSKKKKRHFITASALIIIQFNHLTPHFQCFCLRFSLSPL